MSEARERARARRWLVFTALGLGILMVGLVVTGFASKRRLVVEIEHDPQALLVNERFVKLTVENHLEELERELAGVTRIEPLTVALAGNDRQAAFDQIRAALTRLRTGPLKVTRLSAYTPIGVVIVHGHDAESHGESMLNDRRLVFEGVNTRATVKGVELEKDVPFLFALAPLNHQGKFIGLLELGTPLVPALENLRTVLGGEVAMISGPRLLQSSKDALFTTIAHLLNVEEGQGTRRQVVTQGNATYATSLIPMRDVSGREVLTLVIASDASGITDVLRKTNLVSIGISLAGFLLAVGLLYALARRLDAFYATLETRVAERTAEVREATAVRQRLEGEIAIARDIQMSLLPRTFIHRDHVDLFATLEPAREVGGDFYDLFMLDAHHVGFVVGDVSGKGVPASLHMAMTKTLIKAAARRGLDPGETLADANEELCFENDACVFVTIFIGVLDTQTGDVTYASAGHNPPLLLRRSGEVELVKAPGIAVGVMEDAVFEIQHLTMAPGDALVMYTDGVTEATSARQELFTEARLRDEIVALAGRSAEQMVLGIVERVQTFQKDAPQADDITLLAIRYVGESL